MKKNHIKELAAYVLSGFLAAELFLLLVFAVKWNFFVSLGIAAAVYVGFALVLRPVRKIGKIDADSIDGGEELLSRLETAREGFRKIEDSMRRIANVEVREEARQLHLTSSKIIEYLTANPDRIYVARQFIDYYQNTAAKLLSRYTELETAALYTDDVTRQKSDILEALKTLNRVFSQQFEKLMKNEITDTDAEIRLLMQTVKMEGIE